MGSVDVSSAFPPKNNKARSRECAHLALTTSFALTALYIWRLTCPCRVCNHGKKGKPQNLAHSAVASGVQGCGRVGSCLPFAFTYRFRSFAFTPCLRWLPTLPACRARHTAAQVGCWPVARLAWPAAAAIHMGDEARTANITVLHECSSMRTRGGRARDQFHHDISTTQTPLEALRNSSLFQVFHRGLVFLKCCMDTCQ